MRMKLQTILVHAAVASLLLVAACKRSDQGNDQSRASTKPGSNDDMGRRNFSGDKKLAVQGRQLFLEYNCYGCHGGLAGGAMGPSLRDTTWKYGGTDSLIYHSIHDGRPMGMPPWAGRLNDRQIGAIIQYIRSLRTGDEPQFFFAQGGDTTAAPAPNAAPPAVNTPVPMAKKPSGR
jgi:hypothetical protein